MSASDVNGGAASGAGWRFGELLVVAGVALGVALAVHVAFSLAARSRPHVQS